MRAVVSGVEATGRVQDVRAPVTAPGGHDVLVQFSMKGDPDTADKRVQPVLDAVAAVRAGHPGVRIDEFGDATANSRGGIQGCGAYKVAGQGNDALLQD